MSSPCDLVGERFGKLTVIERAGSTKQQKALWRCSCDCGSEAVVTTGALKFGTTKSCGCRRQDVQRELGPLRRQIDYSKVQCHLCGKNLTSRFMAKDGTLKKRLHKGRLDNLACKKCHKSVSHKNGLILSEKNSSIQINSIQNDIIIGSILGDGSLERSQFGNHSNWSLAVKHGLKQERYCLWKAGLLGGLVSNVDYPANRVRFRTKKHKLISKIAFRMVRSGKKSVDARLVSQMGPLGFAIWYLDDGSLLPNRISKKGVFRKPCIRFATCSFSEEENLALRRVLEKKVGVRTIRCSWTNRRCFEKTLEEPKRTYGIQLYGENAERFLEFIHPHVDWEASGMAYKADVTLRGPLDNKYTRRRKS